MRIELETDAYPIRNGCASDLNPMRIKSQSDAQEI